MKALLIIAFCWFLASVLVMAVFNITGFFNSRR